MMQSWIPLRPSSGERCDRAESHRELGITPGAARETTGLVTASGERHDGAGSPRAARETTGLGHRKRQESESHGWVTQRVPRET